MTRPVRQDARKTILCLYLCLHLSFLIKKTCHFFLSLKSAFNRGLTHTKLILSFHKRLAAGVVFGNISMWDDLSRKPLPSRWPLHLCELSRGPQCFSSYPISALVTRNYDILEIVITMDRVELGHFCLVYLLTQLHEAMTRTKLNEAGPGHISVDSPRGGIHDEIPNKKLCFT